MDENMCSVEEYNDCCHDLKDENQRLINDLLFADKCLKILLEFKTFIELNSIEFRVKLELSKYKKYKELCQTIDGLLSDPLGVKTLKSIESKVNDIKHSKEKTNYKVMTTTVSKPQPCPQPSEAKTRNEIYICDKCRFQTRDHSQMEFHISLAHSEIDINGLQVSQPLNKRQKTSESVDKIADNQKLVTTVEPIVSDINRCQPNPISLQTLNIQNLITDIDKTSVSQNVLTEQSDKKVTENSTLYPTKTEKHVVNEVRPGIVVPTHNILFIPNTVLTNTAPIAQPIESISHNANQPFGSELYLNRHSNIPQNDLRLTTSIASNPQTIYKIVRTEDVLIPTSFPCNHPKCHFVAVTETELKNHKLITHEKFSLFEGFKNEENRGIAISQKHLDLKCHMTEDRQYKCPKGKCKETSNNLEILRKHYIRDHIEKNLSCDWPECDYKAKKKSELKDHMRRHTNERNFACDWPECGKTFKTSKDLLNHVKRTHSQEKPHACHWPDCDYRSYTSSQLKEHLISHSNEYNYLCVWPECGKKFKTKRYLEIHMRIHNNDKRYVCQYTDCQYRTCFAANIKTHMKVHRK